MKKLILIFISIFMLISCNNDDNNDDTQNVNPTLIGKGNLMGSEGIPSQNIVIDNDVSWNAVISLIDQYRIEQLFTSTNVDFTQDQLIAVFDNTHENEGHTINITDITENNTNIVVTIETSYTPTFLPVMIQPFHIVKIPKSNKPVIFQ